MSDDLDEERAVLEVVEFSESEDEGFDYKEVEVRTHTSAVSIRVYRYRTSAAKSTRGTTTVYFVCAAPTHDALGRNAEYVIFLRILIVSYAAVRVRRYMLRMLSLIHI